MNLSSAECGMRGAELGAVVLASRPRPRRRPSSSTVHGPVRRSERNTKLPMNLGAPASLPAWLSARNTPAGMPAVPTTRRFMAGEQVRTEHETSHEPSECGVRDAECGTGGSGPRFSSSSSSSSLVLAGSWPVRMCGNTRQLPMNRTPWNAQCRRPHRSASTALATETGAPTGSEHSTSNVQRSTFNGRGGWTLNVERLAEGHGTSP